MAWGCPWDSDGIYRGKIEFEQRFRSEKEPEKKIVTIAYPVQTGWAILA
jgi:hypothetical protein